MYVSSEETQHFQQILNLMCYCIVFHFLDTFENIYVLAKEQQSLKAPLKCRHCITECPPCFILLNALIFWIDFFA